MYGAVPESQCRRNLPVGRTLLPQLLLPPALYIQITAQDADVLGGMQETAEGREAVPINYAAAPCSTAPSEHDRNLIPSQAHKERVDDLVTRRCAFFLNSPRLRIVVQR